MKIVKVSCLALYDDANNLFLQDRRNFRDNKGVLYGWWGGGTKENETPEQTLLREAKEELNIELNDFEFIGNFERPCREFITDIDLFIAKAPKKFICEEGKPFRASIEEARNLFNDSDIPMLNAVKEWLDKNVIC